MHHGEDSTVSNMVQLDQGQDENQGRSWVQLQKFTENRSGEEPRVELLTLGATMAKNMYSDLSIPPIKQRPLKSMLQSTTSL